MLRTAIRITGIIISLVVIGLSVDAFVNDKEFPPIAGVLLTVMVGIIVLLSPGLLDKKSNKKSDE